MGDGELLLSHLLSVDGMGLGLRGVDVGEPSNLRPLFWRMDLEKEHNGGIDSAAGVDGLECPRALSLRTVALVRACIKSDGIIVVVCEGCCLRNL